MTDVDQVRLAARAEYYGDRFLSLIGQEAPASGDETAEALACAMGAVTVAVSILVAIDMLPGHAAGLVATVASGAAEDIANG